MVSVTVEGTQLHIEVLGWDKLWAFTSRLEFPLGHIREVRRDAGPALGWCHGLRLPGTDLPGLKTAGTFHQHDGAVFFDVSDPERAVVFELEHEEYRRLVVEVRHPDATVAAVTQAIAGQRDG